MPISMRCPGCDTRFDFDSGLEGKRIKCKSCGDIFRVEKPSRKPRDDDDDRPRVSKRRDEEDDDRPRPSRRRDEDDDRPLSRTRWAMLDDDEDDRPRRRDEDEEEAPPKKKTALFLILSGAGLFLLIGVVILIVVLRGKRGSGSVDPSDIVKAPTKSCPLEIPERDIGLLVIPDSGNTFGILRKTDTLKKIWTFEPYDISTGRRLGRVDMPDTDEPRAASLSPNGKYLMLLQGGGFANAAKFLSIWSIGENPPRLIAPKWNPYPRNPKVGQSPVLYRAEFVGNDKVATISTARTMDVWPLPTFDPPLVAFLNIAGSKEHLGKDAPEKTDRFQRQLAFSPDHSIVAVWNGDGYTFVRCVDGQEIGAGATLSVAALAKEIWPNDPNTDPWIKAEGCAFSPDGKALAGVITSTWGGKKHALCIWDVQAQKDPVKYAIPDIQYRDSPSIAWWGNRYIATHGGKVEGMIIDVRSGLAKRQVMGPASLDHYGYGRDGRLWYVTAEDRGKPATVQVVDGLDPDLLIEADDYEQIRELDEEFYLRRLWLEPAGVLRKPTRYNPPLRERLIRRP